MHFWIASISCIQDTYINYKLLYFSFIWSEMIPNFWYKIFTLLMHKVDLEMHVVLKCPDLQAFETCPETQDSS